MTQATRPSPPLRDLVVSTLTDMDKTLVWLAAELGWSRPVLNSVLWSDQPLTVSRAVDMERVLDVHAELLLQSYITAELELERRKREG